MILDAPGTAEAIAEIFGAGAAECDRSPVSGGCINRAFRLRVSNGETLFLKENTDTLSGMFAAEARGLEALHSAALSAGGPRVPKPLAVGREGRNQFILMTYIHPGRPGPKYAEQFGRMFAALHSARSEKRYGFDGDNYIGATPQPNRWCDEWTTFFGRHRLGFQIGLIEKSHAAPDSLIRDVRKLIDRLDTYLPASPQAALLHGDLWSGNGMADEEGTPVIIDPAAYYGHNEADLAMTELFGGFSRRFYDAYNEVLPISPEYRSFRRRIYGLYHLLNHINLFGSSYVSQAASAVRDVL